MYNQNKDIRRFSLAAGIALIICCNACKKFVVADPPTSQITSDFVFADEATAKAAVTGLYSSFLSSRPDIFDARLTTLTSLSADDLTRTGPNPLEDAYTKNAILSNNIYIASLWSLPYKYIYQTNAILEGLAKAGNLSDGVKVQLGAEAKFVRAFAYFHLINLFGDVPLIVNTNYEVNAVKGRALVTEIYDQIVNDLKDAQTNLPDNYATERIRPIKAVATALLARVYLYRKDYPNAEAQATTLINSPAYSLETTLTNVFLKDSKEAIWQLKPVDPAIRFSNTSEGLYFTPASATAKPAYILNPYLLNAFEPGDARKTSWTSTNTIATVAYTYPSKYKVRSASTYVEYIMVLRLAEQYLIRAEARANRDNIAGCVADLNTLRDRARAAATPAIPNPLPALSTGLSKDAALLAVEHERQVELFVEFGHRWFDLKRTGRINAVLGVEKTNWRTTAALFPLPQYDVRTNIYLKQNDGYQ